MTSPPSTLRTRAALRTALLAVALVGLAGCPTQKQLDTMPGLADVRPLGPKGQKCFDYCASSEVACKEMCPHSIGICDDDCVIDTKECLVDCPELQRPEPPPKK